MLTKSRAIAVASATATAWSSCVVAALPVFSTSRRTVVGGVFVGSVLAERNSSNRYAPRKKPSATGSMPPAASVVATCSRPFSARATMPAAWRSFSGFSTSSDEPRPTATTASTPSDSGAGTVETSPCAPLAPTATSASLTADACASSRSPSPMNRVGAASESVSLESVFLEFGSSGLGLSGDTSPMTSTSSFLSREVASWILGPRVRSTLSFLLTRSTLPRHSADRHDLVRAGPTRAALPRVTR